jgi:hypothetical protein
MSIPLDQASTAISASTKGERSKDCNKSAPVKIQARRFVCNATRGGQERNLLQTACPAAQNRPSLLGNLQGPTPLHRS